MTEFIEAPALCGAVLAALNAMSANAGSDGAAAPQLVSGSDLYPGTGPLTRDQLDQDAQQILSDILESPNADLIRAYSSIAALYRGEWQGTFPSQSEADAAFCGYLTAEKLNPLQIDMVLRTSSLYRKKWERTDYRCRTLGLVQPKSTVPVTPLSGPHPADWVDEMNERYAVVRVGSEVYIMDFQTPSHMGYGGRCKAEPLKIPALKQLQAGQYVTDPVTNITSKKADAWLNHPRRRQYEQMVFAPGESLPANILNLWQGLQIQPQAGDVEPWFQALHGQVPEQAPSDYVLHWLAWKVQNPGKIPAQC